MATTADIRNLAIKNVGGIERAERMVRVDPQAWTLQFERARQQLQGGSGPQTFDVPFLPDIPLSEAGTAIREAFPAEGFKENLFGPDVDPFGGTPPGDEPGGMSILDVTSLNRTATPSLPAPATQQIPATPVDTVAASAAPARSEFGAQALGLDEPTLTPPEEPLGPVQGPLTTPTEDAEAVDVGEVTAEGADEVSRGDIALGTSLLGLGLGQAQEGATAVSQAESFGGLTTAIGGVMAMTGNSKFGTGLAVAGTVLNMIGQRRSAAAEQDFRQEFSQAMSSALRGARSISG
jgi:hypothetical protein